MDLGLTSKVAVITGAGAGFGLVTTKMMLAEGAHVVGGSEDIVELTALDGVTPVELNLAAPDAAEHLIRRAIERHGRVDVLINNIGPIRVRPDGFLAIGDDEVDLALRLNLFVAVQSSLRTRRRRARRGRRRRARPRCSRRGMRW
jgi:NAD(P)-dependent dehydrogenase (short-subunit alcohol dehydrogenase family)